MISAEGCGSLNKQHRCPQGSKYGTCAPPQSAPDPALPVVSLDVAPGDVQAEAPLIAFLVDAYDPSNERTNATSTEAFGASIVLCRSGRVSLHDV